MVGGYYVRNRTDCPFPAEPLHPDLCKGEGDACNVPEQSRDCETHCDTPTGPIKAGTQVCQGLCDNDYVWGPCMTDQACN